MIPEGFDRSVFINAPFDADYDPILQSVMFAVVYLGFEPKLARLRSDSAEIRVEKVADLIRTCKYSIHDLSRCVAKRKGEFYRLNMPFELGIDWACRRYMGEPHQAKRFLILEERRYRYQAALSDIAGVDIEYHGADARTAVRKVRNWLVGEAALHADGGDWIFSRYTDFSGLNRSAFAGGRIV
jgi:hypothetical protein